MTTLTRCYQVAVIVVLIFHLENVSCSYSNGFITLRGFKTKEWLDEVEATTETSVKLRKKFTKTPYVKYENTYKLRFQPVNPMPRLYSHKFAQQQQEETTTQPTIDITTTALTMITEIPEEPMEPDVTPEPTEPPITPAPETEPPDLETTTMKPTSTTTSPTPLKPSTTFTTIMKPSSPFPFNLAAKLKNLFVYGSPSQVNLIQKHGSVDTKGKTKSKGFLSLFEVIKFANTKCTVTMGDIRTMQGICYHEFECKSLGGISTERCGEGLGVCCICEFVVANKN